MTFYILNNGVFAKPELMQPARFFGFNILFFLPVLFKKARIAPLWKYQSWRIEAQVILIQKDGTYEWRYSEKHNSGKN